MVVKSRTAGDLSFLTWIPDTGSAAGCGSAGQAYQEIVNHLNDHRQVLLNERIYGKLDAAEAILGTRESAFRELGASVAVPPTYIEGTPCLGNGIAGIHAIAARANGGSRLLEWNEQVCGRLVHGDEARYLFLSDISRLIPGRAHLSPAEETRQTFQLAEELLDQARWSFPDVCRTWFYLHQILDWYDDFNQIRNQAFTRLGLFNDSCSRPIPASTGIRGSNPSRSWCTLDLLAIRANQGGRLDIQRLSNPCQNEAPEYGSAFSRGLSVTTDHCRYLFVSGTAAIDTNGASIYSGDFVRQVEQTIATVGALLASAGAELGQICQATAFVKRTEDVDSFQQIMSRLGLAEMPYICTISDVCRPELLFELDATAVLPL